MNTLVDFDVYRNLNKGGWSVKSRCAVARDLVIAVTPTVALEDCVFVVQDAGRIKAQETGQRNVHAFASGTLTPVSEVPRERLRRLHYSMRHDIEYFFDDDWNPITWAPYAIFNDDGAWFLPAP